MFCVKNGLEYKYDFSNSMFRIAFEFLKRPDLAALEPGRYELGEGVYANVLHYNSKNWEDSRWEAHKRFFDIQYIAEGQEYMGVCNIDVCREIETPYNPEKDIMFYKEPEDYGKVVLNAGEFIIVGPEDVHKPSVRVHESRPNIKVVVKVPV